MSSGNIWTNFPIQHPTFMAVIDLSFDGKSSPRLTMTEKIQYNVGIIVKVTRLFSSNTEIICDKLSEQYEFFRPLADQLEIPFTKVKILDSLPKLRDDYKFDEALIFFGCPPEETITQIVKNNKYYHICIIGENIPSSIKTVADQYFSANKTGVTEYMASRGTKFSEKSLEGVGMKSGEGNVKYVLVDKQMKDVRLLCVSM
jgi:hypothetical protein